jgi:hypothetical protein
VKQGKKKMQKLGVGDPIKNSLQCKKKKKTVLIKWDMNPKRYESSDIIIP